MTAVGSRCLAFRSAKVVPGLGQPSISACRHLPPGDPSLVSIAATRPGDAVHLIRNGDRWQIDNAQGQTIARLSRAFAPRRTTFFAAMSVK